MIDYDRATATFTEAKRNARWRRQDEGMPETRTKRIHYSEAGQSRIACGAAKAATRGLRFTKVKADVTCLRCLSAEGTNGQDENALPTYSAEEVRDHLITECGTMDLTVAYVQGTWAHAKRLAASFYVRRIEDLMRHLGFDRSACKACKAPIYWVIHANGKRVPYDTHLRNHFSSCKQADAFRRKGKR